MRIEEMRFISKIDSLIETHDGENTLHLEVHQPDESTAQVFRTKGNQFLGLPAHVPDALTCVPGDSRRCSLHEIAQWNQSTKIEYQLTSHVNQRSHFEWLIINSIN